MKYRRVRIIVVEGGRKEGEKRFRIEKTGRRFKDKEKKGYKTKQKKE